METILDNPPSPRLQYLVSLPNTSESLLALTRLKEKEGVHSDVIARSEKRLADCQERDSLAAARPDGCWCLGLGGKQEVYTRSHEAYYEQLCPCPDGIAQGERRSIIRKAEREQEDRQRLQGLWSSAGIPLRFAEMRLSTSPLCQSHPEIVARLSPPHDVWEDYGEDEEPPNEILDAYLSLWGTWIASWFLYGPSGVGKTGLAVGLAWERIKLDDELKSLRFTTAPAMLSELRSTYNRSGDDPTEQDVIDKYAQADLLLLDDLGAEQVKNTGWVEDRLYQIIGERHDNLRPTIFTSNLSIAQLATRIGERITWRIVEMVSKNILHLTGPNLRAH